jgi:hypothetical protein
MGKGMRQGFLAIFRECPVCAQRNLVGRESCACGARLAGARTEERGGSRLFGRRIADIVRRRDALVVLPAALIAVLTGLLGHRVFRRALSPSAAPTQAGARPPVAPVVETPRDPSSWPQDRRLFEKGRRLFAAGDVRGALGPLAEASRALPDDAVVANTYGLALLRAGERDRALFNLQRAVLLAPGISTYRVDMARALVAAGRRQAAGQELEAVLRADPGNAAAAEALATLASPAPYDPAAAGGPLHGGAYTNEDLERMHRGVLSSPGAAISPAASPGARPSPDRR